MRKVLSFFICLMSFSLNAQEVIKITKNNTALIFFPNSIATILNGNDLEFIVKQKGDKAITMKFEDEVENPKKGPNVIVSTIDGNLYEIFFELAQKVENNIHFITKEMANVQGATFKIENEREIKEEEEEKEKEASQPLFNDKELIYVKQQCELHSNRKKRIFQEKSKKSNSHNIILSLSDVAYDKDKKYVFLNIHNKGGQAYDVNWINFFKSTTNTGEFQINQDTPLPLYYLHNPPMRIEGKSKYQFIAVLNTTSISKEKAISVRIAELNGARNLILNIKDKHINKAIKL